MCVCVPACAFVCACVQACMSVCVYVCVFARVSVKQHFVLGRTDKCGWKISYVYISFKYLYNDGCLFACRQGPSRRMYQRRPLLHF